MDYLTIRSRGKYVVWLKRSNRYIVFEEPAWEVFERIINQVSQISIIEIIRDKYCLPNKVAKKFVEEISLQIQSLGKKKVTEAMDRFDFSPVTSLPFMETYYYRINETTLMIQYANSWLKDLFHPPIEHLVTKRDNKAEHILSLFESDGFMGLQVDNGEIKSWPISKAAYFKGAFTLELLKHIYGVLESDFIGSFHAGAVSHNNQTILLPASSGSGKSTLTALLMASGFKLITDDLAVLSKKKEIFPLPMAISVKNGAREILLPLYPEIGQKTARGSTFSGKESIYLSPRQKIKFTPLPVRAIVFPVYDPTVICTWTKVEPLNVLNSFLSEAWIDDKEENVESFLNWFLNMPCYLLRYSDNEKGIEKIRQLFPE